MSKKERNIYLIFFPHRIMYISRPAVSIWSNKNLLVLKVCLVEWVWARKRKGREQFLVELSVNKRASLRFLPTKGKVKFHYAQEKGKKQVNSVDKKIYCNKYVLTFSFLQIGVIYIRWLLNLNNVCAVMKLVLTHGVFLL